MTTNIYMANHRHIYGKISATILNRTILLALCLQVLIIVIMASVPPVSRDALSHHLLVPKLYLMKGSIQEIPEIKFSYYPMNVNLFYLIPLYFGNDIVPKFIHFGFALLTAWLIADYLQRRLNLTYALVGALFFLTLPIILKLSVTVYVDLGLTFFSTAAMLALFYWHETGKKSRLIIAAVLCGLAMGTKYNGLITCFLLTALIPSVYTEGINKTPEADRSNETKLLSVDPKIQLRSIKWAMLFVTIAVLVVAPWLVRNFVWKANPVYPLCNSYFTKAPATSSTTTKNVAPRPKPPLNHFAFRTLVYGESWWEIALIPFRVFFQGQDGNPKLFDGRLNPLLFLFAICAFLVPSRDCRQYQMENKVMAMFGVLFILIVFLTSDMRIRYFVPAIPPFVILAVLGLNRLVDIVRRAHSKMIQNICYTVLAIGVLVGVSLNLAYLQNLYRQIQPLEYLSGRITRDEYISHYRPEYLLYKHANDRFAAHAKILGLFLGNRSYYSDLMVVHQENLLRDAVKRNREGEEIGRYLKQKGFSYILVNTRLLDQWIRVNFAVEKQIKIFDFFKNYTSTVKNNNGYTLYAIVT